MRVTCPGRASFLITALMAMLVGTEKILPHLNAVLKACVACHLEYKVTGRSN